MNNVKKWSDLSAEPISVDAIRALHVPADNFKAYVNLHEASTIFTTKAGHAFTLYVLDGSCKTTIAEREISLHPAQCITLDQGAYTFEVISDNALKLVKVFSLS